MERKCKSCGAELEDDAMFCTSCGATQEESANQTEEGTTSSSAKSVVDGLSEKLSGLDTEKAKSAVSDFMKKLPPYAPIAAAAGVVAMIALCLIFGSGGYKGAVKDYYKAFRKGNSKKMITLTYPKDSLKEEIEEDADMSPKKYYKALDEIYDVMWDGLKDVGDIEYKYEIKRAEKLGKLNKLKDDVKGDIGGRDLDDFIDFMDDADLFDEGDFDANKIKKCYAVEVKCKLEVEGEELIDTKDVSYVYKYRGDWYILDKLGLSSPATLMFKISAIGDDDFDDVYDDMKDAIGDLLD